MPYFTLREGIYWQHLTTDADGDRLRWVAWHLGKLVAYGDFYSQVCSDYRRAKA